MRAPRAACLELVAQLKAAGFTGSSIDPTEVNPPAAVLVQPRTITGLTLGGGATLTVWCYLLAPNVDADHAMRLLDDGLEGLLALDLALSDDETAVDLNAALILPGAQTPLPAYRLAVDLEL
jgi:hypothetical protein